MFEHPHDAVPMPPPPPPVGIRPPPPAIAIIVAIYLFFAALGEINGLMNTSFRGSPLGTAILIDSVVFMVAKVVMGIGLLTLSPWARVGAILTLIARFVLGNLLTILQICSHPSPIDQMTAGIPKVYIVITMVGMGVVSAGIYGVFIFFLTRRNVKEAFAR